MRPSAERGCRRRKVYGAPALGWPDTESGLPDRTPLPRKGNEVTWI